MEAFKSKDPTGTGYISPLDFQDIMVNVKKHLLTPDVKDNLVAVSVAWRLILFRKTMVTVSLSLCPSSGYRRTQS